MLKSRAGNDQSVQTTTCAIWGRSDVFTIVNSVVRAVVCGDLKSTSKYGSNSVAAGAEEAMSHVSSLFVDVGSRPLLKVAFGAMFVKWPPANAELAANSTAVRTMSLFTFPPAIGRRCAAMIRRPIADGQTLPIAGDEASHPAAAWAWA